MLEIGPSGSMKEAAGSTQSRFRTIQVCPKD